MTAPATHHEMPELDKNGSIASGAQALIKLQAIAPTTEQEFAHLKKSITSATLALRAAHGFYAF
jgi:cellobiose-specific phosphotransferase system component IIA